MSHPVSPVLPRISVCIPTFNNALLVQEAIRSALDQDYPNLEVIVVDNASTDNTLTNLETLKQTHPRGEALHYHANPTNIGMTGNFRRVLELATGKYVTFVSSDDLLYPGALTALVGALEAHPEATFAFTQVAYIGERQGQTRHQFPAVMPGRAFLNRSLGEARNFAFLCSATLRRDLGTEIGISELFFFDWFLWLQLALRGDVCFVDQTLGAHRYHAANETKSLGSVVRDGQKLMQVFDAFGALPAVQQDAALTQQVQQGKKELFLRYLNLALKDKPLTPHVIAEHKQALAGDQFGAGVRMWASVSPYWNRLRTLAARLKQVVKR